MKRQRNYKNASGAHRNAAGADQGVSSAVVTTASDHANSMSRILQSLHGVPVGDLEAAFKEVARGVMLEYELVAGNQQAYGITVCGLPSKG